MDCTNINSAAEILHSFRDCKNSDEELELFKCLANRLEPPVEAFLEIVKIIKLESVLALTIQALGKIINPAIKAELRANIDLLKLLSQKIESGSSDLIQLSAAIAIEEIGFDFFLVAQHLTQYPHNIADSVGLLDLILEEVPPDREIPILKAIRTIFNLGLKEGKQLIEVPPKAIAEDLPREEAERIKEQLELAGAKVSVRPTWQLMNQSHAKSSSKNANIKFSKQ